VAEPTAEQLAAEAQLEAAFRAVADAYEIESTGEFIGDWLVIIETPHAEGDPEGTPYQMLTAGGTLPHHRAAGLLSVADAILNGTWVEDDDE